MNADPEPYEPSPDIPDLTDPLVRQMADRHHTPDEAWTLSGQLLGVHCETCNRTWPCPTRQALTDISKEPYRP